MKFIKKILNNKLYVVTFLVSTIIIGALYKLNNVTPLGTNSLLCVDFFHQYGPMLGELYDRIRGFDSLIYSFSMAGGLPFFRNFLNYLSSPFNIIMLFFPRSQLLASYSFIIGFKAIASSLTCVYYLSKKFNTKELYIIPMGIIYAFSAYFSAYYWNIMWLDGMVFLPLITLGIENIVNHKKWKLYTFSLFIMLVANYFIGYMICIYAVVYFLIYNIYKTHISFKEKDEILNNIINAIKEFFSRSILFGVASLLAGCLGAFLLLPMASSMASISATGGTMPTSQYYDFHVLDFIISHLTGNDVTVFASDAVTSPNISCGILSIALLLLYLVNHEIKFKNKICYLLVLGFFLFAFFNPQLDYILHAFHVPNDLPYRYSFLYSFVLIVIATYSLINIKKVKLPLLIITYAFLMATLLYVSTLQWDGIATNIIYINMILLTLYFVFFMAYRYLNELKYLFYGAIIVVAGIDVLVAVNNNWDITQVVKVFYEKYDSTERILGEVRDRDKEPFYRIENVQYLTLNDSSWYGYNGLTTFSSMAYESLASLNHNLGLPGNVINSYMFVHSTPVYDLMFDIKYFLGTLNDENRYTTLSNDDQTLNEFNYNVGLAFGTKDTIKDWGYDIQNPFENQNSFIKNTTGVDGVFEPALLVRTEEIYKDDTTTIMKYDYENTGDNMYIYSNDSCVDYFIVGNALYYNNDTYETTAGYADELYYDYVESYEEKKVINIKSSDEVITFYVAFNYYYPESLNIYNIYQDKFEEAYNYLKKYKLDIKNFKEHKIEGNITLDENMSVYTSIPYDEGWHVYVDNEEVETYKNGDALLGFDADKGTHSITFKYKIPYFKIGAIISILAATVIILSQIYKDKISKFFSSKKKDKNKEIPKEPVKEEKTKEIKKSEKKEIKKEEKDVKDKKSNATKNKKKKKLK